MVLPAVLPFAILLIDDGGVLQRLLQIQSQRDLKNREAPWLGDTKNLGHSRFVFGHMLQDVVADDDVEVGVREWDAGDVHLHRAEVCPPLREKRPTDVVEVVVGTKNLGQVFFRGNVEDPHVPFEDVRLEHEEEIQEPHPMVGPAMRATDVLHRAGAGDRVLLEYFGPNPLMQEFSVAPPTVRTGTSLTSVKGLEESIPEFSEPTSYGVLFQGPVDR